MNIRYSSIQKWLLSTAIALATSAPALAQDVIFPQDAQPGAATLTSVEGESFTLSNNILSATFTYSQDGKHLIFGGCEEMGLKPGSELFFIETQSDGTIPASQMQISDVKTEKLLANPNSPKGAERFSGHAIAATFTHGNISIAWRAVLRNGSHYLRTEMTLTSDPGTQMRNIIPMNYVVAEGEPTVSTVGNTRGAILASTKIFAGVESPMGINSVGNAVVQPEGAEKAWESDGFKLTSWNQEMFSWTPGRDVPSQILELGFDDSQIVGAFGHANFAEAGQQTITFNYSSGTHKLNIAGVDITNQDGTPVASDYHLGSTGNASSLNTYTLDVPAPGEYIIRYFIEIKTETITSSGNIAFSKTVTAIQSPDGPTLSASIPESDPNRYWYIKSNRNGNIRYVTEEDNGELLGATEITPAAAWSFVKRSDGTWDIINGATTNYITTTTVTAPNGKGKKLTTSSTPPASGWQFLQSDNRDAVIIVNGTVQFNTTNSENNFKIFDWGGGTNTSDLGCQYYFAEMTQSGEVIGNEKEPNFTSDAPITGRWSRNTTLAPDKTWTISAVVGLVAPGQTRRSVLAYIERERAVTWRAFPMYNSWYELNINRNNDQNYTGNFNINQCVDVLNQWKTNLYDKHDAHIQSYVWDDGWDIYGTWQFNPNFPNGFSEADEVAHAMGANIGAWLGPVGGYGQSGNYRRAYWNGKGGMQLSNPAYYDVFLTQCSYMVNTYHFNYFKFDGISGQFSSTGPDSGTTGEENAEAIIDIEQQIRKVKPDIFFNTTVGTWASPFWYHVSDATWRQENDFGKIGNQGSDREQWITYRDRLVYQNYVTNSPLCPINSLMTHGVILTNYGNVAKDMSYDGALREIRCAFACGSSQVELYCDYSLLNSINNGALWADIAECIKWQIKNADVLPDAHWVGGNPWDGSNANVYGWASWNGEKSTLAIRNPRASATNFSFTLREALEIPQYVSGSIVLTKSFTSQAALEGITEGEPIDIDATITAQLPASSIFVFDGLDTVNHKPDAGFIEEPVENPGENPGEEPGQDSITEINANTASTPVFDLLGRRVNNPRHGIYILNGKKIRL